jgi:hypothetical protein
MNEKKPATNNQVLLLLLEDENKAAFAAKHQILPLTPEDKHLIFSSLRYSFMTHQQLIALLAQPGFEEAKDYIREGIS